MSEIRDWLFAAQDATLCTLAAEPEIQGFPFGSLTPFAFARMERRSCTSPRSRSTPRT